MLGGLFESFMGAPQGQRAMSQLQAQGFAPQQSQGVLQSAFPVAARAVQQQGGGESLGLMDVGEGHYVSNFLTGAITGLVRGEGLMGSAADGLQGVVGGHVTQVIASRYGLPQRVAGMAGAVATPLIIDFLFERIRGGLDLGSMQGGGAAATAVASSASGPPRASGGSILDGVGSLFGNEGGGSILDGVTSALGGAGFGVPAGGAAPRAAGAGGFGVPAPGARAAGAAVASGPTAAGAGASGPGTPGGFGVPAVPAGAQGPASGQSPLTQLGALFTGGGGTTGSTGSATSALGELFGGATPSPANESSPSAPSDAIGTIFDLFGGKR